MYWFFVRHRTNHKGENIEALRIKWGDFHTWGAVGRKEAKIEAIENEWNDKHASKNINDKY